MNLGDGKMRHPIMLYEMAFCGFHLFFQKITSKNTEIIEMETHLSSLCFFILPSDFKWNF